MSGYAPVSQRNSMDTANGSSTTTSLQGSKESRRSFSPERARLRPGSLCDRVRTARSFFSTPQIAPSAEGPMLPPVQASVSIDLQNDLKTEVQRNKELTDKISRLEDELREIIEEKQALASQDLQDELDRVRQSHDSLGAEHQDLSREFGDLRRTTTELFLDVRPAARGDLGARHVDLTTSPPNFMSRLGHDCAKSLRWDRSTHSAVIPSELLVALIDLVGFI